MSPLRSHGCSVTASCGNGLGRAGVETAADYAWERRIDALERFLGEVAEPTELDLDAIAEREAEEGAADASGDSLGAPADAPRRI